MTSHTKKIGTAAALLISLSLLTACGDAAPDAPKPAKVTYKSCVEAPGPLMQGEPGYSLKLDRDHDGIACND